MPSFAAHLLLTDPALRQAVAEQLTLARFTVTGEAGLTAPPEAAIALIVDAAGETEALTAWRAARPTGCIFRLGENGGDADGAADIVTESFAKPLRLGHLLARLHYHLDVAPRLRSTALVCGPYRFDPQNRQLTVTDTGMMIRLTEKEAGLLEFIGGSTVPVAREEILTALWGYDGRIDTHTLETHIYQLRRKLDTDPRGAGLLVNEQGAYRLMTEGAA